jgi:ABC-type transport system substrate-binding protein
MRYAPVAGEAFVVFNLKNGPFTNLRLRRAVDLALDRPALATVRGDVPSSQYLPPAVPGGGGAPVVPVEPSLARARALAAGFHGTVTLTACTASNCRATATIIKASLEKIGLKTRIDLEPNGIPNGTRWDMQFEGWYYEWPDPADLLNVFFDPKAFRPPGYPPAEPVPPAYRRMLEAAERRRGTARATAYRALAAKIERNVAPIAVRGRPVTPEFFSARMGCQVEQPIIGAADLGALCIRG